MVNIIVAIVLIVCPLFHQIEHNQELYLNRAVNIVHVQPPRETFTQSEKDHVVESVHAAFDFWHDYLPTPVLQEERDLQIQKEPYLSVITEWCNCSFTHEITDTLTIFVVDNSNSRASLGGIAGYPSEYFSFMVVLLDSNPSLLSAQIAHELGHIYFNLPDFYKTDTCQQIDIMCYPNPAFKQKFIGCLSLQHLAELSLSSPCKRIYLPSVTSPD